MPNGRAVALYIGVAGNLHYRDGSGTEVPLTPVLGGEFPCEVTRVYEDSTAASILALYNKR